MNGNFIISEKNVCKIFKILAINSLKKLTGCIFSGCLLLLLPSVGHCRLLQVHIADGEDTLRTQEGQVSGCDRKHSPFSSRVQPKCSGLSHCWVEK